MRAWPLLAALCLRRLPALEPACPASGCPGPGLLDELLNRSYVVVRGAVPQDKVRRAVEAMERPRWSFGSAPGGAQRIMEVLELDPVFAELVDELPEDITRIADALLSPSWQLGSYHGHVIHPEGTVIGQAQREQKAKAALHSDFPYGHATAEFGGTLEAVPEQFPFTLQLIWMLTPFTPSSGSTMIYPGSHRDRALLKNRMLQETHDRFMANAVQVTGQPGDIVLYIGQAWHIWGVNEAPGKRVALLGQVLPFFFKHMESHVLKTPAHRVRLMPPRARERLGFEWDAWFKHSRRLLPFPRSPLEGLETLVDMLLVGYAGPMDLRSFKALPKEYLPLVGIAEALFQFNRWVAVLVLMGPFLLWACLRRGCCSCCSCCRRCQHGLMKGSGLHTMVCAARASALLFVGMVAGVTLHMDRVGL